ncbi:hypothetical protein [Rhodanobacter sp. DHB23]|uniref:hypothetical protein n=1 Tax=Rhodanobacter sp. DHB23 TaxID=2775923 RepID=UPI00177BE27F|nr:hypothetical protein [Rhodanobacter sp. DHB23]MBD8873817.1 hypothetical protein [Rhodanobacter sp. DHB23]
MTMNMVRLCAPSPFLLAFAAAVALVAGAASQAATPVCPAPFAKLLSFDVFHDQAVRLTRKIASPTPPDVKEGRAYLYRTVIKEEAKLGPNFADHYTIIRIGCGAATTCLAIADAKSGHVYFPPDLESVEALLVDTGRINVDTLNYRRDSRLLVVVGSPNEKNDRAGISYYTWQSEKLKLIRFIPAATLCGLPASTQF